jgi:hypothetical protein
VIFAAALDLIGANKKSLAARLRVKSDAFAVTGVTAAAKMGQFSFCTFGIRISVPLVDAIAFIGVVDVTEASSSRQ